MGIQDDDCDSGFWEKALQDFGEAIGLSQPDVADDADPLPIEGPSPCDDDDEGPVESPKSEHLSDGSDAERMENPKVALLGKESSEKKGLGNVSIFCLSIKISSYIYIFFSFKSLSIYRLLYRPTYLPVYLSIYLPIYLPIYPI